MMMSATALTGIIQRKDPKKYLIVVYDRLNRFNYILYQLNGLHLSTWPSSHFPSPYFRISFCIIETAPERYPPPKIA